MVVPGRKKLIIIFKVTTWNFFQKMMSLHVIVNICMLAFAIAISHKSKVDICKRTRVKYFMLEKDNSPECVSFEILYFIMVSGFRARTVGMY